MFKRKFKAWGLQKNIKSHEMNAILQDIIHTHWSDLTQRTGTKTVFANGRWIEVAQIKRYMRRKRLPPPDVEPCTDTQASHVRSATCLPTSVFPLRYEMTIRPHISAPQGLAWPSTIESSNSSGSNPLSLPLGNDTALPHHLMLEYPDSVMHKRTLMSTSDDVSHGREDRQSKRACSSHRAWTSTNFACPFYKHDPAFYNPQNADAEIARRYRSCAGPGWKSIRRLRCVEAFYDQLRNICVLK